MSSGDELVKYITERVVTYIETPKEERHPKIKEPWSVKWFGMIPFSLYLWKERAREELDPSEDLTHKHHVTLRDGR
ncbi:YqzE family protein [Paenibacillus pini]|uniref:YqzE family protein n=1 Tax=Paenibacillus pini JCM 16418 TaxID=1236976 RepID=W7YVX1_9BACL|nr:YqzE family protein [Paenibacillus pini]GAF06524.1 hypothetical protein JCM16418_483 [Paenibacillus pini JCM 16418]